MEYPTLFPAPTLESENKAQKVVEAQNSKTIPSVMPLEQLKIALAVAAIDKIVKANEEEFTVPGGDGKLDVTDPSTNLGKSCLAAIRNVPAYIARLPEGHKADVKEITGVMIGDILSQATLQKLQKGAIDPEFRATLPTGDQFYCTAVSEGDKDCGPNKEELEPWSKGLYHTLTPDSQRFALPSPADKPGERSNLAQFAEITGALQIVADKRGNGMLSNTPQEYAAAASKNQIDQDGKINRSLSSNPDKAVSTSLHMAGAQEAIRSQAAGM